VVAEKSYRLETDPGTACDVAGEYGYAHVVSVVTNPATTGNSSIAQTWGYDYSGDSLLSACPLASATACTAYTYTAGSDYPAAVLDSGPQSYWRLDETSGTQANSSVLAIAPRRALIHVPLAEAVCEIQQCAGQCPFRWAARRPSHHGNGAGGPLGAVLRYLAARG
jgi:hypothetical protein